jgi:hypothetical protein
MLIALTGKAGSGKSTVADILEKEYNFVQIALADPLKDAVSYLFGLTDEQKWDRELKETIVSHWGLSPRQMFQQFGDAMKEKFGEDFFVKIWDRYCEHWNHRNVVVPDCRFDVEAERFRELNGYIVEVVRGTGLVGSTGQHRSEFGLSTLPDFTIDNRGSLDLLKVKVASMLNELPNE